MHKYVTRSARRAGEKLATDSDDSSMDNMAAAAQAPLKDTVNDQLAASVSSTQGEQRTPDGGDMASANATQQTDMQAMETRLMAVLNKLDAKVDTISKNTEQIRQEFDQKLQTVDSKVDLNTGKVSELETSLNYAHKTIEEQKDTIAKMQKEVKECKGTVSSALQQVVKQGREKTSLQEDVMEQFNELERRTRNYNIRIRGVPEASVNGRQDHRSTVAEVLVKNKLVNATEEEVIKAMEIAHPLGKPLRGKYNLIAKFYARPYRNAVVKAAKQHTGDWIGADKVVEDLTKQDRDRKTRAYPQMQMAYGEGKKVRFQNGQLVIDGVVVAIDD